jgi:hypothetical protein
MLRPYHIQSHHPGEAATLQHVPARNGISLQLVSRFRGC